MQTLKQSLIVAWIVCLSACSTTQSLPPMEKARSISAACLSECETLPTPLNGSDKSIRTWQFEAIETYGECRRLHAECVEWSNNAQ